tara:strand:- start:348 stop:665 length:318 start_codon:yes stop_codon:yes gene_type:complete
LAFASFRNIKFEKAIFLIANIQKANRRNVLKARESNEKGTQARGTQSSQAQEIDASKPKEEVSLTVCGSASQPQGLPFSVAGERYESRRHGFVFSVLNRKELKLK